MSIYGTEKALLEVIANSGRSASRINDQSSRDSLQEIEALQGKVAEIAKNLAVASELFMKTPSEAGTQILQQMEIEKNRLEKDIEARRNNTFLLDHRANWKEVKFRLEKQLHEAGKHFLEVIPVSIKEVDGKLEFMRHVPTRDENEIIALREQLRAFIDRIAINIPMMKATIQYKNGEITAVEFRKEAILPQNLRLSQTGR